jgi:4-amino-4-deoxy-L-arabinose transferase-like glycosyltransferase
MVISSLSKLYLGVTAFVLVICLATFLRVYELNINPPALFGDEVDVGYQAYSLLTTGKDVSGRTLPLYLKSLTEYRASFYIYSAVPFVGIFGLNEWGVRLPAAFWGVVSLIGLFLLTRKLFNTYVGLSAMFLMAISPWHLQYSRGSFEVTMLLSFLLFAAWFTLLGLKKGYFLLPAALLFAASFYIYSTAAVFVPLLLLLIGGIYLNNKSALKQAGWKWLGLGIVVGAIVLSGVVLSIFSGQATNRFSGISIFTDSVLVDKINLARTNMGYYTPEGEFKTSDQKIESFFHNKPSVYLQVFATNYSKALSFNFLFSEGDINFRQSIHEMGELYYFEIILLVAGIWYLVFREERKKGWFVFGWLLLAPIPASLTADGGYHATRLFIMLPPLMMLNALGLVFLVEKVLKMEKRRLGGLVGLGILSVIMVLNMTFYFHRYYQHYPVESWRWWHVGFKEAMQYVADHEDKYEKVFFNNTYEPSLSRYLMWTQADPKRIQSQFDDLTAKDNIVEGFHGFVFDSKYYFGTTAKQYEVDKLLKPGYLYMVAARDEVQGDWDWSKTPPPAGVKVLKTVVNPQGAPIFYVVTKQ